MITKMEGMSPEVEAQMKQIENLPPEAAAMMKKMNVNVSAGANGITTTVTQCITRQNPVPKSKKMKDCQETHTMNGDTVNFHVICNQQDMQMDSTGQVTYTGDTLAGKIKSHEVARGRNMDAAMDITGQYVGPC